ncbi:hypothetical protein LSUE1_G006135 [Lachnellula suecica]|uniref:Transglycosylase SLT domain-containing protein n=1 Tax=Lachnellula suecica TaxID=602035 RepID=A0A8T9C7D6_9HELO|nr:hypothetical protein LSUE1_G006135 [Lachnellula suecica]
MNFNITAKLAAMVLAFFASTSSAAPRSTAGPAVSGYAGDGTPSAGWPSVEQWASYETMWANNRFTMGISCEWMGKPNSTPEELDDLNNAIHQVAAETGVDARLILAVVMQESKACVRVHTTYSPGVGSHANPGLMQSHAGTFSCHDIPGRCPAETIVGMVRDGTAGTAAGDGLVATLAQAHAAGAQGARAAYIAARIYNSGFFTPGALEDGRGATGPYATDIANRLMGSTVRDLQ